MVAGAVGAEVFQNIGQRVYGHSNLQEVVGAGDHAIVGTGLAAEGERCGGDAFVEDAVGEHGLGVDAEDEGAELGVAPWRGFGPHGW